MTAQQTRPVVPRRADGTWSSQTAELTALLDDLGLPICPGREALAWLWQQHPDTFAAAVHYARGEGS